MLLLLSWERTKGIKCRIEPSSVLLLVVIVWCCCCESQAFPSDEVSASVGLSGQNPSFLSDGSYEGRSNRTKREQEYDGYRSQCEIQSDVFPCCYECNRSPYPPTTAHELRPGDIDVIVALGDSITAGTGALANNVIQVGTEYRGVSFCMGGDANWKRYLTLPNILKTFNPYLYGYSVGERKVSSPSSNSGDTEPSLNLAQSGAESDDVIPQARRLVARLKSDPKVDYENDWKFVTVLVGHNDLCSYTCDRVELLSSTPPKDASPEAYVRNVAETLDILHRELPRTFVNLMPVADVTALLEIYDKPLPCRFTHPYGCPCLFDNTLSHRLSKAEMTALLNRYLQALEDLVGSGRYDTRPDFTVVIQPTLVKGQLPRHRVNRRGGRVKETVNLSYLAPDCFHWSQKLHAMVARSLWNNLLEPVNQKTTNFRPDVPLLCPTEEYPYLATSLNSVSRASNYKGSMEEDYFRMERSTTGFQNCPL